MSPEFARLLAELEPHSGPQMTEYAPSSIAMSLKRIADAQERMADVHDRLVSLYERLACGEQPRSP
jgi:hypothetical protein